MGIERGIARSQSTASSHVMSTQHERDFENSVQARILKNTREGIGSRF
jgi:hypothetical protein